MNNTFPTKYLASLLGLAIYVLTADPCFGAATYSLKAVAKNGVAITPTNALNIAPNDSITVEILLFGWNNPPFDGSSGLVQTYQVTLLGYDGVLSNIDDPTNNSLHVLPVGWDAPIVKDLCPCDQPAYPVCGTGTNASYGCIGNTFNASNMANLYTLRNDYLLFGFSDIHGLDVGTLNIRWGATVNGPDGQTASRCTGGSNTGLSCSTGADCPGGTCNPDFRSYVGTMFLKAGASVCGTTTFTLASNVNQTYIANPASLPVSVVPAVEPLALTAAIGCGCQAGVDCDDYNPCTDDTCQSGHCRNLPNTDPCSDGNPCTLADACDNGQCVAGPQPDCSAFSSPCQVASCDPAGLPGNCGTLTDKPDGTSCGNGIFCDGFERCFHAVCVGGIPPCGGGLGCFEAAGACGPCVTAQDCVDGFDCTQKTCLAGTCSFDASNCSSACCVAGGQCLEGRTPADCLAAGGFFLGPELSCSLDPDSDGITGCLDQCPHDPLKTSPGSCGCNGSDLDSDLDDVPDCGDCCNHSPTGEAVDQDGCPLRGGCQRAPGSCAEDVTEGYCASVHGLFLGNGSSCDVPCVPCPRRSQVGEDVENPPKTRFISFAPPQAYVCQTALRVRLVSLHHVMPPYTGGSSVPFTNMEGQVRWVGPPSLYLESTASAMAFQAATLQCTPYYQDWSTVGLLHVTGSAIVPSSVYDVETLDAGCAGYETDCDAASPPLRITTTRWGDVEMPYNPPEGSAQPDQGDVAALINKFKGAPLAPIKARAFLSGDDAMGNISPNTMGIDFAFTHIADCLDAFRGKPYPYAVESCP